MEIDANKLFDKLLEESKQEDVDITQDSEANSHEIEENKTSEQGILSIQGSGQISPLLHSTFDDDHQLSKNTCSPKDHTDSSQEEDTQSTNPVHIPEEPPNLFSPISMLESTSLSPKEQSTNQDVEFQSTTVNFLDSSETSDLPQKSSAPLVATRKLSVSPKGNTTFTKKAGPPSIISKKIGESLKEIENISESLEDHSYSFETTSKISDSKSIEKEVLPLVSRSVFSSPVSNRNSVDILQHKDKINILRQMSQVFNNENEKVLNGEDIMTVNKDSEIHLGANHNSNLDIDKPDSESEPNEIATNTNELNEKATDTSELINPIQLAEVVSQIIETEENGATDKATIVHLVSSKLKDEQLKIDVRSLKGDNGEDIDIIDGFAFVSFENQPEMPKCGKKRKLGKSRKRARLNPRLKKKSKVSHAANNTEQVLQAEKLKEPDSGKLEDIPVLNRVNTENAFMSNILENYLSNSSDLKISFPIPMCESTEKGISKIEPPREPLKTLTNGPMKNVVKSRSTEERRTFLKSLHPYNRPQPKRVKIAKGIPYEEFEPLVKACTYRKPEVFKMSTSKKQNMQRSTNAVDKKSFLIYVYCGGRLVSLRGAVRGIENPSSVQMKIVRPVGQSSVNGAKRELKPVEINEDFAEFALSALKTPHTSNSTRSNASGGSKSSLSRNPVLEKPTKDNIMDIIAAKLQIDGSEHWESKSGSETSRDNLKSRWTKNKPVASICESLVKKKAFTKNCKRFPSLSREMKRLNMNFVRVNEDEDQNLSETEAQPTTLCTKQHCKLGCVCDSLSCRTQEPVHCGNQECMLECTCQVGMDSGTSTPMKSVSILKLDQVYQGKLATKEKEFSKTVVQSDSGVYVIGGTKRKRDIKIPERFRDAGWAPPLDGTFPKKTPLSTSKGIPPSDYLKRIKKFSLKVPWFKLDKVSVWCMVHSCYDCVCLKEPTENEVPKGNQTVTEAPDNKVIWLFRQPSSDLEVFQRKDWLMKYWIHNSDNHCSRTCGYSKKNIQYEEDSHFHSTVALPETPYLVGATVKSKQSNDATSQSSAQKVPVSEPIDFNLPKSSDSNKSDNLMIQPLYLHSLIKEEEQRGELELDLCANTPFRSIVVTETRFRKLISMCIIGVIGVKNGRCFIGTGKTNVDLLKMKQLHHLIGSDTLDVGPYMKEIFFPSQAEARTKYVMVKCDRDGQWEIRGIAQRKPDQKQQTTSKSKKMKHVPSKHVPTQSLSSAKSKTDDLSAYVNEQQDTDMPFITSVMSVSEPANKFFQNTGDSSKVAFKSATESLIPAPATTNKPQPPKLNPEVTAKKSINLTILPRKKQDKVLNKPISNDQTVNNQVALAETPQPNSSRPTYMLQQTKNHYLVLSSTDQRRPMLLVNPQPIPSKSKRTKSEQPILPKPKTHTNEPSTKDCNTKMVHESRPIVSNRSMSSRSSSTESACSEISEESVAGNVDNDSDSDITCVTPVPSNKFNADSSPEVECVELAGNNQCSAIDMRIPFEKIKLHWVPGTMQRAIIRSIFKLSFNSKVPISLTVRHDGSVLKFFGRSIFKAGRPIVLLGSLYRDVSYANNKPISSLFRASTVKYSLEDADGTLVTYGYNRTGTHLLKAPMTHSRLTGQKGNSMPVSLSVEDAINQTWISELLSSTKDQDNRFLMAVESTRKSKNLLQRVAENRTILPNLLRKTPSTTAPAPTMVTLPPLINIQPKPVEPVLLVIKRKPCPKSKRKFVDQETPQSLVIDTPIEDACVEIVSTSESSVQTCSSAVDCEPLATFSQDDTAQLLHSTVTGNKKSFGIACYTNPPNVTTIHPPQISPKSSISAIRTKTFNQSTLIRSQDESKKKTENKLKRPHEAPTPTERPSIKDESVTKKINKYKCRTELQSRSKSHHNVSERLRRKSIGLMFKYVTNIIEDEILCNKKSSKIEVLQQTVVIIEQLKQEKSELNKEEYRVRNERKQLLAKMKTLAQGTQQEETAKQWTMTNLSNPSARQTFEKKWTAGEVAIALDTVEADTQPNVSTDAMVSDAQETRTEDSSFDLFEDSYTDSDVSVS